MRPADHGTSGPPAIARYAPQNFRLFGVLVVGTLLVTIATNRLLLTEGMLAGIAGIGPDDGIDEEAGGGFEAEQVCFFGKVPAKTTCENHISIRVSTQPQSSDAGRRAQITTTKPSEPASRRSKCDTS